MVKVGNEFAKFDFWMAPMKLGSCEGMR